MVHNTILPCTRQPSCIQSGAQVAECSSCIQSERLNAKIKPLSLSLLFRPFPSPLAKRTGFTFPAHNIKVKRIRKRRNCIYKYLNYTWLLGRAGRIKISNRSPLWSQALPWACPTKILCLVCMPSEANPCPALLIDVDIEQIASWLYRTSVMHHKQAKNG